MAQHQFCPIRKQERRASKFKRIQLAVLWLPLLVGCNHKRDVTGQVFVSTDGGVSFKLGSVPVAVYRTEALHAQVSNYIVKCDAIISAESTMDLQFAQEKVATYQQIDKLQRESNELANKRSKLSKQRCDIDDKVEALRYAWSNLKFPANQLSAESKRRLEDDNALVRQLLAQKESLGSESLAINERISSISGEINAVETDSKLREQLQMMGRKKRLADLVALIDEPVFPAPERVVSTDADGAFRLTLDGRADYSIATLAERVVFDDKREYYYWVVSLKDVPKETLLLNNLNISNDLVVRRSALEVSKKSLQKQIDRDASPP